MNLIQDKALPSRPDVEKNILGTLLVDPVGLDEIKNILEPSSFYMNKHAEIYSTMLKMRESGIEIDVVTLPEYMSKNGFKVEYDLVDYVAELCQFVGSIKSLPEYCKIINEKAIVRQIITKNSNIIQQCFAEDYKIENMITQMESNVVEIGANCDKSKINRRKSGKLVRASEVKERMFEYRKSGLSGLGLSGVTLEQVWPVLGKHIKFSKRMLNIFTGIPGHGKSEILDDISVKLAAYHGWKTAVFSPENYPYELHVQKLIEKLTNTNLFKTDEHVLSKAIDFIDEHFYWIEPDEDNIKIDNLLSMNLEAKKKHGISSVIWDPWNEIDMDLKTHEKETDYIGRSLGKIRRHARRHDYMMNIIAHPTKIEVDQKTRKYKVPTLYSVSGSSNWYNKADNGFCTYRHFGKDGIQPVPNIDFHIQKIKFKIHGQVGVVQFNYDRESGRFIEHDIEQTEMEF